MSPMQNWFSVRAELQEMFPSISDAALAPIDAEIDGVVHRTLVHYDVIQPDGSPLCYDLLVAHQPLNHSRTQDFLQRIYAAPSITNKQEPMAIYALMAATHHSMRQAASADAEGFLHRLLAVIEFLSFVPRVVAIRMQATGPESGTIEELMIVGDQTTLRQIN